MRETPVKRGGLYSISTPTGRYRIPTRAGPPRRQAKRKAITGKPAAGALPPPDPPSPPPPSDPPGPPPPDPSGPPSPSDPPGPPPPDPPSPPPPSDPPPDHPGPSGPSGPPPRRSKDEIQAAIRQLYLLEEEINQLRTDLEMDQENRISQLCNDLTRQMQIDVQNQVSDEFKKLKETFKPLNDDYDQKIKAVREKYTNHVREGFKEELDVNERVYQPGFEIYELLKQKKKDLQEKQAEELARIDALESGLQAPKVVFDKGKSSLQWDSMQKTLRQQLSTIYESEKAQLERDLNTNLDRSEKDFTFDSFRDLFKQKSSQCRDHIHKAQLTDAENDLNAMTSIANKMDDVIAYINDKFNTDDDKRNPAKAFVTKANEITKTIRTDITNKQTDYTTRSSEVNTNATLQQIIGKYQHIYDNQIPNDKVAVDALIKQIVADIQSINQEINTEELHSTKSFTEWTSDDFYRYGVQPRGTVNEKTVASIKQKITNSLIHLKQLRGLMQTRISDLKNLQTKFNTYNEVFTKLQALPPIKQDTLTTYDQVYTMYNAFKSEVVKAINTLKDKRILNVTPFNDLLLQLDQMYKSKFETLKDDYEHKFNDLDKVQECIERNLISTDSTQNHSNINDLHKLHELVPAEAHNRNVFLLNDLQKYVDEQITQTKYEGKCSDLTTFIELKTQQAQNLKTKLIDWSTVDARRSVRERFDRLTSDYDINDTTSPPIKETKIKQIEDALKALQDVGDAYHDAQARVDNIKRINEERKAFQKAQTDEHIMQTIRNYASTASSPEAINQALNYIRTHTKDLSENYSDEVRRLEAELTFKVQTIKDLSKAFDDFYKLKNNLTTSIYNYKRSPNDGQAKELKKHLDEMKKFWRTNGPLIKQNSPPREDEYLQVVSEAEPYVADHGKYNSNVEKIKNKLNELTTKMDTQFPDHYSIIRTFASSVMMYQVYPSYELVFKHPDIKSKVAEVAQFCDDFLETGRDYTHVLNYTFDQYKNESETIISDLEDFFPPGDLGIPILQDIVYNLFKANNFPIENLIPYIAKYNPFLVGLAHYSYQQEYNLVVLPFNEIADCKCYTIAEQHIQLNLLSANCVYYPDKEFYEPQVRILQGETKEFANDLLVFLNGVQQVMQCEYVNPDPLIQLAAKLEKTTFTDQAKDYDFFYKKHLPNFKKLALANKIAREQNFFYPKEGVDPDVAFMAIFLQLGRMVKNPPINFEEFKDKASLLTLINLSEESKAEDIMNQFVRQITDAYSKQIGDDMYKYLRLQCHIIKFLGGDFVTQMTTLAQQTVARYQGKADAIKTQKIQEDQSAAQTSYESNHPWDQIVEVVKQYEPDLVNILQRIRAFNASFTFKEVDDICKKGEEDTVVQILREFSMMITQLIYGKHIYDCDLVFRGVNPTTLQEINAGINEFSVWHGVTAHEPFIDFINNHLSQLMYLTVTNEYLNADAQFFLSNIIKPLYRTFFGIGHGIYYKEAYQDVDYDLGFGLTPDNCFHFGAGLGILRLSAGIYGQSESDIEAPCMNRAIQLIRTYSDGIPAPIKDLARAYIQDILDSRIQHYNEYGDDIRYCFGYLVQNNYLEITDDSIKGDINAEFDVLEARYQTAQEQQDAQEQHQTDQEQQQIENLPQAENDRVNFTEQEVQLFERGQPQGESQTTEPSVTEDQQGQAAEESPPAEENQPAEGEPQTTEHQPAEQPQTTEDQTRHDQTEDNFLA